MKKYSNLNFIVLLIVSILVSLTACEVEYDPEFTPLIMYGPTGSNVFGTPVTISTTIPEVVIGPAPSPNRKGDPRIVSYEEVWCGDVEKICYELCFEMECGIYDASSPRVQQFINAVDDREAAILGWESEARSKRTSGFTAFTSCVTAVVGSAPAYAVVTAADPEPISKTILAVAGVVVAGVICVNSVLNYSDANTEQNIDKDEIMNQQLIAEQSFGFLRDFGEEVDLDE